MVEEVEEEIPPYEDWIVKDLKAELVARKLNHSGAKAELVERLYMDDELGVDEVEEDAESEPGGDAEVEVVYGSGWVDGNYFYMEYVEDIGRDDFNSLPTTETHHRLLVDVFHCAVAHGDREVAGGLYDGQLVGKRLYNNSVTYQYRMMLKP